MEKIYQPLRGYGIQLRPVNVNDASFILDLRNMPHAQNNIPSLNITLEQEQHWLSKNIHDPNDYFYIIESYSGKKLGTISVYSIDYKNHVAEEGRLVILPISLAMVPAFILLFDFCFYTLQLALLTSWCVATNKKMIAFKYESGCQENPSVKSSRKVNGQFINSIAFTYSKENYLAHRDQLVKVALAAEKFQVK